MAYEDEFALSGLPGSGTAVAVPTGSVWDSLDVNGVWDKLIGAGITRAAYEINKPLYNTTAAQRSPDGLLGQIGTFGVSSDTKNFVLLIMIVAAGIFLVPKLFD